MRPHRAGFTLVETLVALVLFQVGIIALVATAGVAARDLAEATLRRRAAQVAAARVEVLLGSACLAATSGSAVLNGGLREWWRVEAEGSSRSIVDSVEALLPRGRRASVVVRAWALCAA